jgi:2-oxoglutarate dehydrogenase E1 component
MHIVRFEQLYPLPAALIEDQLKDYGKGVPVRWVQEEPENQGAWPHLRFRFGDRLPGGHLFRGVCRPVSASPATGSSASHKLEHLILLERVFGPDVRK